MGKNHHRHHHHPKRHPKKRFEEEIEIQEAVITPAETAKIDPVVGWIETDDLAKVKEYILAGNPLPEPVPGTLVSAKMSNLLQALSLLSVIEEKVIEPSKYIDLQMAYSAADLDHAVLSNYELYKNDSKLLLSHTKLLKPQIKEPELKRMEAFWHVRAPLYAYIMGEKILSFNTAEALNELAQILMEAWRDDSGRKFEITDVVKKIGETLDKIFILKAENKSIDELINEFENFMGEAVVFRYDRPWCGRDQSSTNNCASGFVASSFLLAIVCLVGAGVSSYLREGLTKWAVMAAVSVPVIVVSIGTRFYTGYAPTLGYKHTLKKFIRSLNPPQVENTTWAWLTRLASCSKTQPELTPAPSLAEIKVEESDLPIIEKTPAEPPLRHTPTPMPTRVPPVNKLTGKPVRWV